MRKLLLLLLVILGPVGMVSAQGEPDGMKLRGMAQFVELRKIFYIGALYTETSSSDPTVLLETTGRKRMELRVNGERWTPRSFSNQWTQSLMVNGTEQQLNNFDDAFIQFGNLAAETFIRGDIIVIDSYDNGSSEIFVNGTSAFTVERPGFLELLLSKWIGKAPPSSNFKQDMLSDKINATMQEEYVTLAPTTARIDQTAAWFGAGKQQEVAVLPEVQAAPPPEPEPEPAPEPKKVEPVVVPEPVQEVVEIEVVEEEPEIDPEIYRLQQETLLKLYRSSVVKRTLANVEYPRRAVKRNQQGTVLLDVTVDRGGKVKAIIAREQTQFDLLNEAALDALSSTGAFPPLPAGLDGETVQISIPIKFLLN